MEIFTAKMSAIQKLEDFCFPDEVTLARFENKEENVELHK